LAQKVETSRDDVKPIEMSIAIEILEVAEA
jgi:hypothetical protein